MALLRRTKEQLARMHLRLPGVVLLIALFLVLLAAWNTGINLLYLMFAGLASFALMSTVLARWNLARLHVTVVGPGAVHRNERCLLRVRIENRKRWLSAMSLRVEKEGSSNPAGYVLKIPAHMAALLNVSETFTRRGVFSLPQIVIISGYPFDFFERHYRKPHHMEVVVYPRVRTIRAAAAQPYVYRQKAPRVVRGEGDEFFSLREYVAGDDMRRVAWRASAKRGHLFVREFARPTVRSVLIALDTRRTADVNFEDRFEEAVELVASLGVSFLSQHFKVAVAVSGVSTAMGEGSAHVRTILEMLARVEPVEGGSVPFEWLRGGEFDGVGQICVSPDSRLWGHPVAGGVSVLHPREVLRA